MKVQETQKPDKVKAKRSPKELQAPKALQASTNKAKRVTLTVSRRKWGTSTLASYDRKMCIMGHYLNQVGGIPEEDLRGYSFPSQLKPKLPPEMSWVAVDPRIYSSDLRRAVEINDSHPSAFDTALEREERLKKIFKRHKVKLEFVD